VLHKDRSAGDDSYLKFRIKKQKNNNMNLSKKFN